MLGEDAADERAGLAVVLIVVHEFCHAGEKCGAVGEGIVAGACLGPLGRDHERTAHVDVERNVEYLVRVEGADKAGLLRRGRIINVDAEVVGLIDRLVAVGDGRELGPADACVRGYCAVDDAVTVASVVVEEGVGCIAC